MEKKLPEIFQRILQGIAAKIQHGKQQAAEGARLEKEGNEEAEALLRQCAKSLEIDFDAHDFKEDRFVPKEKKA